MLTLSVTGLLQFAEVLSCSDEMPALLSFFANCVDKLSVRSASVLFRILLLFGLAPPLRLQSCKSISAQMLYFGAYRFSLVPQ